MRHLCSSLRQTVATVNARPVAQFHIENDRAHLFQGLSARHIRRIDRPHPAHPNQLTRRRGARPSASQEAGLSPTSIRTAMAKTMDRRKLASPCTSAGSARVHLPPPHIIVYNFYEADLFAQTSPGFRNSSRRPGRPRRHRRDPVLAPGIGNGRNAHGGRAGEPSQWDADGPGSGPRPLAARLQGETRASVPRRKNCDNDRNRRAATLWPRVCASSPAF